MDKLATGTVSSDGNREILANYSSVNFTLKGDRYSRAMNGVRFELIERFGAGRDVLDIGCATGAFLIPMLSRLKSAVGLDFVERFLREFTMALGGSVPTNLDLVCADARAMPLADKSIDFAYSFATLYYIPAVEKVIAELARVVRPGGTIALEFGNVTSTNTMFAQVYAETSGWAFPVHVRIGDALDWIRDAGFVLREQRVFQIFPLYAAPLSRPWMLPLSGRPLRALLGIRTRRGHLWDEHLSGMPGLRRFAFRHLVVAERQ
jgi:ubiquinone/menaquinone biosynthesis C-methylase UbiE